MNGKVKSINNYTEYDDILFWNVIINAFQKMSVKPVDAKTIKKSKDGFFVFVGAKKIEVQAIAKGEITKADYEKNEIEIEHENCIRSVYRLDAIQKPLKEGIKIKQCEQIGIAKELKMKIYMPLDKIFEEF